MSTSNKQISSIILPSSQGLYELKDAQARGSVLELSSEISTKVFFKDGAISGYGDLSVLRVTDDEYRKLINDGTLLSNAIYIISSDVNDAMDQRIVNVAEPLSSKDAATKQYVDIADSVLQSDLESEIYDTKSSLSVAVDSRLSAYSTTTETSASVSAYVEDRVKNFTVGSIVTWED